jgi:hypothetical protein
MVTKLNTWKYRISIKDLFSENTSPELIVTLCSSLEKQLTSLIGKVQVSNLTTDEKDDKEMKLNDLLSNFQFLKQLADGSIKEREWSNYSFDGDYEDMFNGYMDELYDLSDEHARNIKGELEKFIWIH